MIQPRRVIAMGTFSLLVSVLAVPQLGAQDQKGLGGVVPMKERGVERQQRWAILIGVNKYEDEQGIGSLKYCVADMKLLYEVLTGSTGGFQRKNVLLMTDDAASVMHRPTYSNLVTMIPRWLEDVGPEDDVLLAFSGHGIVEDGECYLLPRSAKRGALRLTSVSVPQVREWLDSCRAERKVLILDACHSGAGKAPGQMAQEWKQELETGQGFLRLASCDTKQKSNEDDALGHGVFTYYLAQALQGHGDLDADGRVGVDETYRYVAREVGRWARPHGLRQDPVMSGRVIGGQFTLGYAPRPVRHTPGCSSSESAQTAELYVQIHPPAADVRLDGAVITLRDNRTIVFARVAVGRHILEISKTGYGRVEKVVPVPASGTVGRVKLAPMVTEIEISLPSGRAVVAELISRDHGRLTVKLKKGGKLTLNPDQYEKTEERQVPAATPSVEFGAGNDALFEGLQRRFRERLRTDYLVTVADDFIVDLYHNGKLVPDGRRKVLLERFGAIVERIRLQVRDGDWIVFNVVNNRLRWGGAYYFAVAGCFGDDEFGFVSRLDTKTWSACDSPNDVERFISDKTYLSDRPAQEVVRPWREGTTFMRRYAGKSWDGSPLWGSTKNTWIKVILQ